MSIRRVSNSTALSGFPKYANAWDQISGAVTFDNLGTTTVSATTHASVYFGNIPQTYSHLQIRGIGRTITNVSNTAYDLAITVNQSNPNSFQHMSMIGDGSSVDTTANFGDNIFRAVGVITNPVHASNLFGTFVIDFFNYSDNNRNKAIQAYCAYDTNSATAPNAGRAILMRGQLNSPNPITTLDLFSYDNWAQNTTISLYGIK